MLSFVYAKNNKGNSLLKGMYEETKGGRRERNKGGRKEKGQKNGEEEKGEMRKKRGKDENEGRKTFKFLFSFSVKRKIYISNPRCTWTKRRQTTTMDYLTRYPLTGTARMSRQAAPFSKTEHLSIFHLQCFRDYKASDRRKSQDVPLFHLIDKTLQ